MRRENAIRSLDDLQVAAEMRQNIGCVVTNNKYVLGARAELAWDEDAGLHGEAHALLQHAAVAFIQKRRLVDVESDAVPQAVSEILAVASIRDHLPRNPVDFFGRVLSAAQRIDARLRRTHDELVDLPIFGARLSEKDGPPKVIAILVVDAAEIET